MSRIKTAVIMAAGLGSRFGQYTENIPKGFVPFKGKPMVIHSIETLLACGIESIIIGTGYKKEAYEALKEKFPQIECVFNPQYAETNSMFTLYNCREAVGDENFILLESDLVFEKRAVRELLDCPFCSAMLISPVIKFQDQYYVEMDENNVLTDCSTNKNELYPSGELVGIHKLCNVFYKTLIEEYEKVLDNRLKIGYEYQLLDISKRIIPMNVLKLDGLQWYEIDDEQDLLFAERNIKI